MRWLIGVDEEILEAIPAERRAFTALGTLSLLSTIAVATIFALGLTSVFSFWLSAILAPLWALVILSLDRLLISNSLRGSFLHKIGVAAPRLMLSALLAFVLATPLGLALFDSAISTQIVANRAFNLQRAQGETAACNRANRSDGPFGTEPQCAAQDAAAQRYEDLADQEPGLLEKLVALRSLRDTNSYVDLALYGIAAFLFLVDALPVVVSLLSSPSTYERLLEARVRARRLLASERQELESNLELFRVRHETRLELASINEEEQSEELKQRHQAAQDKIKLWARVDELQVQLAAQMRPERADVRRRTEPSSVPEKRSIETSEWLEELRKLGPLYDTSRLDVTAGDDVADRA